TVSTVALPPLPSSSSYDLPLGVALPLFTDALFGSAELHPHHAPPPMFCTSGGSDTASCSTDASKIKVLCVICGDGASGKHYGVTSCEGCKGFFKRTVRKDLAYACRHQSSCVIDKRQRNRCQFCRYRKCTEMGMRRDAVQERCRQSSSSLVKSGGTRSMNQPINNQSMNTVDQSLAAFHLARLRTWSAGIPAFYSLPAREQATLLHYGWTELILLEMVYRSGAVRIWLSDTDSVGRAEAQKLRLSEIFESIIALAIKFHALKLDQMELGALRLILLFNPDFPSLEFPHETAMHRDRVTSSLVEHCRTTYPNDYSRSTRLLLRLPSLRYVATRLRLQSILIPAPPLIDTIAYSNPLPPLPTIPVLQYHQP
ncbi:hypothetical protein PFISCL1PPCAC_22867, partial [Pristionchus fissidentatus]